MIQNVVPAKVLEPGRAHTESHVSSDLPRRAELRVPAAGSAAPLRQGTALRQDRSCESEGENRRRHQVATGRDCVRPITARRSRAAGTESSDIDSDNDLKRLFPAWSLNDSTIRVGDIGDKVSKKSLRVGLLGRSVDVRKRSNVHLAPVVATKWVVSTPNVGAGAALMRNVRFRKHRKPFWEVTTRPSGFQQR